MEFKQWLINELEYKTRFWVHPDKLWGSGNAYVTFIYTEEHKLFTGHAQHYKLILNNPNLVDKYRPFFMKSYSFGSSSSKSSSLPSVKSGNIERNSILRNFDDLFGRISPYHSMELFNGRTFNIISFWNKEEKSYNNLLQPCIEELAAKKFLDKSDPNLLISTPFGTEPLSNKFDSSQYVMTPEEITAAQQKLHLMGPAEKKAMMDKLGVGAGGIKNPWQNNMEKSGVINPGQKWWASTSENKL